MEKESFTDDKYKSSKKSMSILKANLTAMIYPIPLVILFTAGYMASIILADNWQNGFSFSVGGNPITMFISLFLFFAAFFVLIVLHEITHAVFFLRGCENGRKSITFGVKYATPYCHCEEVILLSTYRLSLLAPLITVCLPLAVLTLATRNFFFFIITITMIFGSGGDLAIYWMTRKFAGTKTYVWDMADEVGCIVYEPLLTVEKTKKEDSGRQ